jgi:hypothetical protein
VAATPEMLSQFDDGLHLLRLYPTQGAQRKHLTNTQVPIKHNSAE